MVPAAAQVYQGVSGTGDAVTFNSGNFDPVSFAEKQAAYIRSQREKEEAERKKKITDLDILKDYKPATDKGSQEIYEFFNNGIPVFAEAMAKGLDPLDPTTETGRAWIKFRNDIALKKAQDEAAQKTVDEAFKMWSQNPLKYDEGVMQNALRKYNELPTISERNEFIRRNPILQPHVDYYDMLGQFDIKPSYRDVPVGNNVERQFYYDPKAVEEQAVTVLQNPQNERAVAKLEADIKAGKQTKPDGTPYKNAQEWLAARFETGGSKTDSRYLRPYAGKSMGSENTSVTIDGYGIGTGAKGFTYDVKSLVGGDDWDYVSIGYKGGFGQNSTPPITIKNPQTGEVVIGTYKGIRRVGNGNSFELELFVEEEKRERGRIKKTWYLETIPFESNDELASTVNAETGDDVISVVHQIWTGRKTNRKVPPVAPEKKQSKSKSEFEMYKQAPK